MSVRHSSPNGVAAAAAASLPRAQSQLPSAAGVDNEDVVITDLFQHSHHSCALQQQPQPHGTQLHDRRHQPPPTHYTDDRRDERFSGNRSASSSSGSASVLSADSLFCSIPGPIRRVWLLSAARSSPARSRGVKRGRPHSHIVDLTSDERLDEWQRAADTISQRQASWRSMIQQHCSLQATTDRQHSSPSSSSSVPHLFVRVDSLVGSSYCPSALSSRQLQLVGVAKRQLHAAGVLRERLSGMEPLADSQAAAGTASLLSGYHSACVSDARCTVTADVHDSLCRSVSGSSIGGVLSVGCYVLLRDVAVLSGSEGRPPHLVVQRYNVCAVQQPLQSDEGDDAQLHDSEPYDDAHPPAAAAHIVDFTQQSVLVEPAVVPDAAAAHAGNGYSSILATDYGESAESLDMLDLGEE